ncbi:MAG: phosphate regulon sensor histidine kinase PhoR [Betaproteobacteria bacterium]|nr:phosphate regulon sensor histidine kinase PhoR [Betaproteobacteria bacterium]
MNRPWRRPAAVIGSILGLGALLWLVAGPVAGLLLTTVLLAGMLWHQLYNFSLFRRWILDPKAENFPEGSGLWALAFSRLLRMQKTQAQTEASLQEALTRFQKAGAALPEAVIILDENNSLQWCNPRANVHFGLDARRDRGHQVTNLLRQPQFVDYLQGDDFSAPLVMKVNPGGMETILSVQVVPYGDHEKLLLGRDITRGERLETMRRDFVANVSHELRTPLTVLTGFLETLSDMPEADPDMMQRSIKLMTQQAVRMSRLVEDLLTLSRLESTNAPPREEDVHVADLLQQLYQDALALSNGRHEIRVRIETPNDLRGNFEELRSAFGNFVSNAIRYTPEHGQIDICWKVSSGSPVFSVRDTGLGIEPHHIDRLTERFYRVDRSRSRETGGTGLGLAIVKHVLSRHQAHLEIESEPGKGSVFRAVFPPERMVQAILPSPSRSMANSAIR